LNVFHKSSPLCQTIFPLQLQDFTRMQKLMREIRMKTVNEM
jgi:hypothetical protein